MFVPVRISAQPTKIVSFRRSVAIYGDREISGSLFTANEKSPAHIAGLFVYDMSLNGASFF
jgi:hypothetical protein